MSVAGTGGTSLAASTSSGKTFTMDFASDFPTLDPAAVQDIQSGIPMQAIYDGLVTYETFGKNPTKIIGDLASTFSTTPNGLTYTFHLRKGVRFSNGDPLTAKDVKWSFDRVTSADANGPSGASPYQSAFSAVVGFNRWSQKTPPKGITGLVGITTPDPYTVVIQLKTPQAYFLNELALQTADIMDPKVVNKYGAVKYQLHAVGTGPYKLLYWHQNQQMELVPNPYYNGPDKPKLSRVVFNVNVTFSTQLLLFEQGKVDMIYQPDSATYLSVVTNPTLKKDYRSNKTNAIWYLALNTTKAPFNNPLVRQAVNLAINRQPILKLVNGRGSVMTQPLPPAMPGYDNAIKGYSYNPTRAKQLLQQAGYKKGLTITYVYTSGRPFTAEVAQNVQEQLSKVGITVRLHDIAATGSYWPYESVSSNPFNMSWSDWWQDYPDPQDFLFNLLDYQNNGSLDVGSYHNAQFDSLVQQADSLPSSQNARRMKLYDQAEQIWFKDAPWVPIYYPVIDALVQPWVGPNNINVILHPVLSPQIRFITVSKH